MTRAEFNDWLKHYCTLFPETSEWIARVNDELRSRMLDAWYELLADIDVRDAKAVTWRMFEGDEGYPALGVMFGDREKTPRHVRDLARKHAWDRREREQQRLSQYERDRLRELTQVHRQSRQGWHMGDVFRRLVRHIAEGQARGLSHEEAHAHAVAQVRPLMHDDQDEPELQANRRVEG